MKNEKIEQATLSLEGTATYLGISRGTVFKLIRQGDLPFVRLGKRVLVPKLALDRMLENPVKLKGFRP